jgi:hypothetical protein
MLLLSHTGDGASEMTWPRCDVCAESCWRQLYRVMLAMVLLRRFGSSAMLVLSYAGDRATEATWSRRDVGADDHANVTPGLICT